MPQISIKVKGAELVRKGLESLRAEIPKIGRERVFHHMTEVVKRMKRYPPKPKGSKYVRTFKLQRSWKILRKGDNGYTITADPISKYGKHYGKYVVGDAFGTSQAEVHAGRWQLFRDVAENELDKLPKSISDSIGLAIKRKGLG